MRAGRAAALAVVAACAARDSDIAPDVRARERRAADAPIAWLAPEPSGATLRAGDARTIAVTPFDSAGTLLGGRALTFTTGDPRVAHVDAAGRVSAVATGRTTIEATSGGRRVEIPIGVAPAGEGPAVVDVFPGQVFQEMTGWAALAEAGQTGCGAERFARYRAELLRRAVEELGLNRLHLYIRSGMEAHVLTGRGPHNESLRAGEVPIPWFEPVNDNADPQVIDSTGFQFAWFDQNVEQVLLPMRDRLAARGERLAVTLTYVDFAESPYEQLAAPEEYAELLLAVFQHLRGRYGIVPDEVDALNEPEHTPWEAVELARAIVAAGDRLKANGFTPTFIAPSHTNAAEATRYYDTMVERVPRVRAYLRTLGYHRYAAVTRASLARIGATVRRDGVRAAMTEHIGADVRELHDDLSNGLASAWLQFALAWCTRQEEEPANAAGGAYYRILPDGPDGPRVSLSRRARFLRQYFPFVRLGARRVGATSSDTLLAPLAFRNVDGRHVVVLAARAGGGAGAVLVRGLPPGDYATSWTTPAGEGRGPPMQVAPGAALAVRVPESGVLTIFAR